MKKLPVIEVFGPTIQGEGALAGRVTHFIRFGGCDFRCEWCDTDYAVLPEKVKANVTLRDPVNVLGLLDELEGDPNWVTMSGGNPGLLDLGELVERLHAEPYLVAIETQGSTWKKWMADLDMLTVSPKPPSSHMHEMNRSDVLLRMAEAVHPVKRCLKVPVYDRRDFEWAKTLHLVNGDWPFYLSVVTEMGGLYGTFAGGRIDTRDTLLDRYKQVVEWAANDPDMGDVAVFPQMHVLVWGHGRGF